MSIQFFVCKFDWFSYQFAALISVSCTEIVKGKTQIYDVYYIVIMAPVLVWEWSLTSTYTIVSVYTKVRVFVKTTMMFSPVDRPCTYRL